MDLELRKKGIGGSDAAAVCGVSHWKSALQLYHEKRGELAEEELNSRPVRFGKFIEPFIAAEYALETGNTVIVPKPEIYWHPQHDFIFGHPDRLAATATGERIVLECKSSSIGDEWGDPGTDAIPHEYILQAQHYLSLFPDILRCDLAVLLYGRDLKIYTVIRDDVLIGGLIDQEIKFWQRVKSGNPPEIDKKSFQKEHVYHMLRRLYPGTNGQTISLPPAAWNLHKSLIEIQEMEKEAAAAIRGLKSRIMHYMKENAVGLLQDGTAYTRKANKNGVISMRHTNNVKEGK